jgi:hypothetical protein
MRPTATIQSEVQQTALELGMLRGDFLHRERQLTQRFDALDAELRAAAEAEKQQTNPVLHERLAAVEAALTNATKET